MAQSHSTSSSSESMSNESCQCDFTQCGHRVGAARNEISSILLRNSLRDLDGSRNRFVPHGCLISEINHTKVVRWLQTCIPSEDIADIDSLARIISPIGSDRCRCGSPLCTGSRIIFATLMLLAKEAYIVDIIEKSTHEICDSTWPLDGSNTQSLAASALEDIIQSFGTLEQELFTQLQWQMRSPIFLGLESTFPALDHLTVPDQLSLPWTAQEKIGESMHGELSSVHRIKIHADHFDFETVGDTFALKVLEKGKVVRIAETDFEDEMAANQRATHPRITPLLAAFKHRNKFYLLFPWADGGNLQQLWRKYEPYPGLDGQKAPWFSVGWMVDQCYHIADALATIHGHPSNEGGHFYQSQLHHDIKPENVLCFDDSRDGTSTFKLKLTDFGLSLPADSQSNLPRDLIAETKTYRPPERDIEGSNLGQKWDIWCLGCLYLDFITWAILGHRGVRKFEKARLDEKDQPSGPVDEDTFFIKKRLVGRCWWPRKTVLTVAEIKSSVILHIRELLGHVRCSDDCAEFLRYIEERMLVIDSNQRDDSSKVRDFLHKWAFE